MALAKLSIISTGQKQSDVMILVDDQMINGVHGLELHMEAGEVAEATIKFYVDKLEIDTQALLALHAYLENQKKDISHQDNLMK